MENASPTGTCRTGETRRTINQTIRRIYHCPDPHLPLLLNSSNHQSYPSHMSYTSHCSNSGAKHPCPHLSFLHDLHGSTHPLTFRPFGRLSASKTRLYQRSFIAHERYSRLPLPSISLNSTCHIIRFPLQYDKSTSIIRLTTQLFSSFHCLVADVKIHNTPSLSNYCSQAKLFSYTNSGATSSSPSSHVSVS